MTQNQTGQPRDPGNGRGEVIADEAEGFPDEQAKPMTRFQKVASALRGDGTERDDPDEAAREQPVQDQAVSDLPVPDRPVSDQPVSDQGPDVVGEQDPSMTRSDTYGSTDTDTGTIRTPYQDEGDQVGTEAGYGSRDVTAMDPLGQAGTGPAVTGVSTAEPPATGRHAAGAADAGLRPGEATDRLGDFSDIAFGNLLPDADQYTAQWERIQFRFVDDPQGSVTEAADTVSQVTAKLEAAIQERQRAIEERQRAIQERAHALRGRWGEGSQADTETLRETLRMYRVFMDQLIGPTV
jgi:hypothetical protein